MTTQTETITLAGGCFWCIEAALNTLQGIISAKSGYMGGEADTATYESVCSGRTGHAEVVQVEINPEEISIRELLEVFFSLHNPTQLNRQGNDIGSQYRSGIFYHNASQKQQAEQIIAEIEQDQIWPDPVVTEVTSATAFYPAEKHHQDYFNNNPENQYCQMVVSPKLAKFKQTFANKLKV